MKEDIYLKIYNPVWLNCIMRQIIKKLYIIFQYSDFLHGKMPVFPLFQFFIQVYTPEGNPLKEGNFVTDTAEHPFYLVVSSLGESNCSPVPVTVYLGGFCGGAVKNNPRFKAGNILSRKGVSAFEIIKLFNVFFGGKQVMGKVSVVGEKDKAHRILVQSSGREQVLGQVLFVKEIKYGGGSRVVGGTDVTCRFVQHDIEKLPAVYLNAVKGNDILLGHLFLSRFYNYPVDGNPSLPYRRPGPGTA